MREMIKRVREERGGFTLAELLIVVAIILVLVAVAVPVFTGAMDNANKAVGHAAGHAVKSEAITTYLLSDDAPNKTEAVTYTAKVQKNGTVSAVTVGDAGTDVTNLTDAAATTLGQSISADSNTTGVDVKVTVTGTDVSK